MLGLRSGVLARTGRQANSRRMARTFVIERRRLSEREAGRKASSHTGRVSQDLRSGGLSRSCHRGKMRLHRLHDTPHPVGNPGLLRDAPGGWAGSSQHPLDHERGQQPLPRVLRGSPCEDAQEDERWPVYFFFFERVDCPIFCIGEPWLAISLSQRARIRFSAEAFFSFNATLAS